MILARTFLLAAAGAGLFWLLGLPLPFLLGPMFACLAAALMNVRLADSGGVGIGMRTILGVAVGASITPDLIHRLPQMGYSIALIPPFIMVLGLVGYPWFRRVIGLDHATSYYASMPGGLQDMLVFGEEAGANLRALSLIHATRVVVVVTLMPLLLHFAFGLDLTRAPGDPALTLPVHELALMAVCAVVGWKGAQALGLFGAAILGPLLVTAIASLAGIIEHRPPAEAILVAQFFIGIGIGAKYAGITVLEIRRYVTASMAYCVLLALVSTTFALTVIQLDLAPAAAALMAFAPGGQSEMAVLAIVAGIDVAYVVTHHLLRIVLVILGAPLVERLFGGQPAASSSRRLR